MRKSTESVDVLVDGGAKVGPGDRFLGGTIGVEDPPPAPPPPLPVPCTNLRSEGMAARGERGSKVKEEVRLSEVGDAGAEGIGVVRVDEGSSVALPEVSIVRLMLRACKQRAEVARESVGVSTWVGEGGTE